MCKPAAISVQYRCAFSEKPRKFDKVESRVILRRHFPMNSPLVYTDDLKVQQKLHFNGAKITRTCKQAFGEVFALGMKYNSEIPV